jgi:hypothetical protein
MLARANILFFVFHTALILFNVFGWMHPRLRLWNLLTLSLTLVSWLVLGLWKGIGYCVCTEWHWNVRRAMGIDEQSDSYLELLSKTVLGWSPPTQTLNDLAAGVFAFSFLASLALNLRDRRRRATLNRAAT